ncbi:MAG: ankyrin repeat domain-containing protein [Bryobacteraceae bacterium]
MTVQPLLFDAPLTGYEAQAQALFDGYSAADPKALGLFRGCLPRFMDKDVVWLSTNPSDAEIVAANLCLDDARMTVARQYNFRDWEALTAFARSMEDRNSRAFRFESAVEAVIDGDCTGLRALLAADPELVRARSARICNFDPPEHRATLLHYAAANGVEGYRQRTPPNAVAVAKLLLSAGAEVDAIADMYGAPCTTMSMLVSSGHPAAAGVQVALIEALLDAGAAIDGAGADKWGTPLMTALLFGFPDAAYALARRGAHVDLLSAAAGLGNIDQVQSMLPSAPLEDRHSALAISAQLGQVNVVRLLLDAGEDPNRYNPPNQHAHSTPLHQAIAAGHIDVVRMLVERGARLDIKDTIFKGSPLGWAEHCNKPAIADYLRSQGAKTSAELDS